MHRVYWLLVVLVKINTTLSKTLPFIPQCQHTGGELLNFSCDRGSHLQSMSSDDAVSEFVIPVAGFLLPLAGVRISLADRLGRLTSLIPDYGQKSLISLA